MAFFQVFSDSRVFLFGDALEEAPGSVTNIICITHADHMSIFIDTRQCWLSMAGLASTTLIKINNFISCKHIIALSIDSPVICMMTIMLGTHLGISFNVSLNINTLLLKIIGLDFDSKEMPQKDVLFDRRDAVHQENETQTQHVEVFT